MNKRLKQIIGAVIASLLLGGTAMARVIRVKLVDWKQEIILSLRYDYFHTLYVQNLIQKHINFQGDYQF